MSLRSGRTSRMAEEIAAQLLAGEKVVCLVHQLSFADYIRPLIARSLGKRTDLLGNVRFESTQRPQRLRGLRLSSVFEDHSARDFLTPKEWLELDDVMKHLGAQERP